jgi:hypothetical protein
MFLNHPSVLTTQVAQLLMETLLNHNRTLNLTRLVDFKIRLRKRLRLRNQFYLIRKWI